MVTVILPGYSSHNKDWADEVSRNLKVGGEIRPVYWDHWTHPEKRLKPKEKARLIISVTHKEEVNIVAKSVGTLVAAYIVSEIPDKIRKVILCGIPSTSDARLEVFKKAFSNFDSSKMICFQNERDPFANPSEIGAFMQKVNSKIKVRAMPRSDHSYPYFEEFNEFLLG